MYREDLALNNLQWLTCHKTQPNPTQLSQYSFSRPRPSLRVWDFVTLSLDISIQLFFFSFLFCRYYCSVNLYVICAVSHRCLSLLYFMQSSNPGTDRSTLSSILASPLFFTYIVCQCHISCVRPYASSLAFSSSDPFVWLPSWLRL